MSSFSVALIAQSNEKTILTFSQVLQLLKQNHPLAKQNALVLENAKQLERQAKGAFDPLFQTSFGNKQFDGKNYYNQLSSQLSVPIVGGIDAYANYGRAEGYYLNPENTLPNTGLIELGVKVPLLQGLFVNERTNRLQRAKIGNQSALFLQQQLNNDLFFQCGLTYLQWAQSLDEKKLLDSATVIVKLRFEAIKTNFKLGDKPAVDTLKAVMQVQQRQIEAQKATMYVQKNAWLLASFLWKNEEAFLAKINEYVPENYTQLALNTVLNNPKDFEASVQEARTKHPILEQYKLKQQDQALDLKMKQEKLKPKLDLKYNFLQEPTFSLAPSPINSKLEVKFQVPIFRRTEKADVALGKLKIQDTEFASIQKTTEITTKLRSLETEIQGLSKMMDQYELILKSYDALLNAEIIKFNLGETDLLFINQVENLLIDAELKFLEMRYLRKMANWQYAYYKGDLSNLAY